MEKYQKRAEDKTGVQEQAAEGTVFACCHCILLQRGSRLALLGCETGAVVRTSAA